MIASDQFSAFGTKAINVIGALSLGAGATIVAVGDTAIKSAAPETWLTPEHVMAASIFGSLCFGIKHLYDFINTCITNYRAWRKRKSAKATGGENK